MIYELQILDKANQKMPQSHITMKPGRTNVRNRQCMGGSRGEGRGSRPLEMLVRPLEKQLDPLLPLKGGPYGPLWNILMTKTSKKTFLDPCRAAAVCVPCNYLPLGVVGCFAVCDLGIFWSYTLAFASPNKYIFLTGKYTGKRLNMTK